jgi:hypothetical protein
MATVTAIAPKSQRSQLSTVREQSQPEYLVWIVVELGKLAITLGEPMTADRQELTARALCDLPREALEAAFATWLRGDKSHLSPYEAEHTRVGVFFPKPAELREIANAFLAEKQSRDREQRAIQEAREWERDRKLHPDRYVAVRDIFAAFLDERRKRGEAGA